MDRVYYPRTIDHDLLEWKASARHKPLLVRGARQVGKSSAVRTLGRQFTHFLEVNFERDREIHTLFTSNLKPQQIASRLGTYYGVPVVPDETLLFLDEIQACPDALRSLWFFYEDYPELHVVAAGSLLEFALQELSSFGVGRIRSLFMYPMSFNEFLNATGRSAWLTAKREATSASPLFDALHTQLVETFRTYLLVGGMPEAVHEWVTQGDYVACQQVLDDIAQSYEDDFSKYKRRADPALLRQTLHSVGLQAGNKFVYSQVEGGYRSEKVKEALGLLTMAGLVIPVVRSAGNGIPLGAEVNEKFVKYLFLDSGLLLCLLGLKHGSSPSSLSQQLVVATATELVNKGHITEMVAGLELLKYQSPTIRPTLYYWQSLERGSQAEIDYLLERAGGVLPLEIKAGTSGSMKSLHQFMQEKKLAHGIRSSLENFGALPQVEILPLYALENLTRRSD